MNTLFASVLEKLTIIEETKTRLVLRELPLLEWLIAGAIFVSAILFALFELWITAIGAVVIGVWFIARANMRLIIFDADTNLMQIRFQSLLSSSTMHEIGLHEVSRALLRKEDTGHSQILLITITGDELGLSAYSQDVNDWKAPIVIAINTILHEAHKDDGEDTGTI